jgi:HPt (histidine-containing phosphotransfer) domain-containing protein
MKHINRAALVTLMDGDDQLLAQLASMFAQTLSDCEARLRLAVDESNALSLRDTAHQLKSRLAYFQAEELHTLALRLERKGLANELTHASALVDELFLGIRELLNELRELTRLPLNVSTEE